MSAMAQRMSDEHYFEEGMEAVNNSQDEQVLDKHLVFVYGTLRRNSAPTHRLPGYMMFKVRGKHFDFPVIQPYPWDDQLPDVYGNILEVSDEELAKMDVYEGVSSKLYRRVNALAFELGKAAADSIPVQVYVGGPALVHTPIPQGVWKIEG